MRETILDLALAVILGCALAALALSFFDILWS